MILHLAVRTQWSAAKSSGSYPWSTRGFTVVQEGYVHCSFEHQWKSVRQRYYADLPDEQLVLLEIDETKLVSPLIVEQLGSATDSFPHIYGEINIDSVVGERSIS